MTTSEAETAVPTSSKVLCAVYGAIAISVTFPLLLIARELRIGRTEATRLGAVDTVLLAVLAVARSA